MRKRKAAADLAVGDTVLIDGDAYLVEAVRAGVHERPNRLPVDAVFIVFRDSDRVYAELPHHPEEEYEVAA
jgi:hypothetical protein